MGELTFRQQLVIALAGGSAAASGDDFPTDLARWVNDHAEKIEEEFNEREVQRKQKWQLKLTTKGHALLPKAPVPASKSKQRTTP
jgi:hypothetical protein